MDSVPAERPLIAIVDDDASLRLALDNLVRSAGYRTLLFESAEACLSAAPGAGIDFLLSDFVMPGATGIELMGRLRLLGCRAPAVIMTAQPLEEVVEPAQAAGAFTVLSKPFDDRELLAAIGGALRRASA